MTPSIPWGEPANPRYFLIYLNTWEVELTDNERISFADHFWANVTSLVDMKPFGLFNAGISLVFHRPDLYPGAYGEIRYQQSLTFTADQWPPVGAGEVAMTRWDDPNRDRDDGTPIMMSHALTAPTAAARASSAFHGAMHSVAKWQHPPDGNDGPINGVIAQRKWVAGIQRCIKSAARFRKAVV